MKFKKSFLINRQKNNPKFSIITVVKNDEFHISKTIKSILSQTFKNYEYLIIDGESEDQTIKKILKYKNKINLLMSEKDKGLYYAMNKAISLTKGKIIVFVNSGDLLKKNALKIVNKTFLKNRKYDYVFGTVERNYINTMILKYGVNINKLKYNFDFATAHSTGFFLKKKIFDKFGLFNVKYKCSADYDLYYRLLITKKIFGGFTEKKDVVGIVKSGGYSSKISLLSHIIEETKIRFDNKQNIFFIILIFLNAVIKGYSKKILQFN
tara:strand:- start:49 stop:846 length:798 start_codon:yes stop_codon:yes gene_type:complete